MQRQDNRAPAAKPLSCTISTAPVYLPYADDLLKEMEQATAPVVDVKLIEEFVDCSTPWKEKYCIVNCPCPECRRGDCDFCTVGRMM